MTRVSPPGFEQRQATLAFRFEGRDFTAAPGETIAGALAVAGQISLRSTRTAELRGPFCGMGVCHECLVQADGVTLRACLTPVAAGMQIVRHAPGLAVAATGSPSATGATITTDIAIVGAGPAGLSAALAAAGCGLDVLVLDERKQAGGQYFKQPAADFPVVEAALDRQFREGRELARRATSAGARMLHEATVWATSGADLLVDSPAGARRVQARRIILATGAAESCPPFPGWTLPGVMTTGAAQSFLRAGGVVPGSRVLIAGAGPLNLQLAAELLARGVDVVAVVEASAGPSIASWPALARMAGQSPGLLLDGIGYRLRLALAGVPVLNRMIIVGATGEARVSRATVALLRPDGSPDPAASRSFDCDLVCVGYGFVPAVELPASMGCDLRHDARWQHLAVATDSDGRTSLAHVFAAGDGARFGGARVAMAAGELAGLAAARDLGGAKASHRMARAARRLAGARAFQDALWQLYAAPHPGLSLARPETLVCRCEHVTRSMIDAACASGATGIGAIKRATRLGMGRCQGRYCAGVTATLLAGRADRQPEPEDYFAPRTPLRPVRIGAVAALEMRESP